MIIVNADDFGLSNKVNEAIVQCFKEGIISSTTLMTNMPYAKEAVELAKKNGFTNSIGFHFNLIEGVPLSKEIVQCSRLCKNNQLSYKRNSIWRFDGKEKSAIRAEFEAQYNRFISYGITPSHLDSHQHALTELPIYLCLRTLIKELGITKIRLSRNIGVSSSHKIYKKFFNYLYHLDNLKTTKFFSSITYADKVSHFDNIELMCHPTIKDGKIIDAFLQRPLSRLPFDISNYNEL